MLRICDITGAKTARGHNVSHANNKTKRLFGVNLHTISFKIQGLGKHKLKVRGRRAMSSIIRAGGIEKYLLNTPKRKLGPKGLILKRKLDKLTTSS